MVLCTSRKDQTRTVDVVVSVVGVMALNSIFVGLVASLLLLETTSSQAFPRTLQEDGTDGSSSSCSTSGDDALDPETVRIPSVRMGSFD